MPFALYADGDGSGGGGNPSAGDPAKSQGFSQADIDAAVQRALGEHNRKTAEDFKAATGHDSLDAFREAQAKAKGEEGKLIDQLKAEKADLESRYSRSLIESQILAAARDAIDPADVVALLSGKASVKDGTVTIDGKSVADAVAEMAKAKAHLFKPAGSAGGGAPANGGGNKNQLTRAEFDAKSPAERAKFMKEGGTVV